MKHRRGLAVPSEEVQDRFWEKVDVDGDCWDWKAATRATDGVGVFGIDGRIFYSHRVAYVIVHGEVPEGKDVRRCCGNPLCVRPLHLYLAERGSRSADEIAVSDSTRWLI